MTISPNTDFIKNKSWPHLLSFSRFLFVLIHVFDFHLLIYCVCSHFSLFHFIFFLGTIRRWNKMNNLLCCVVIVLCFNIALTELWYGFKVKVCLFFDLFLIFGFLELFICILWFKVCRFNAATHNSFHTINMADVGLSVTFFILHQLLISIITPNEYIK